MTGLAHVVAYGEAGGRERAVAGVLEDYVFRGHAALDAWEATGEMRYYEAAEAIAESVLARFYDATGCGFFDTEIAAEGEVRLGALATRRKPLQDSPTPAGNPVAATLLLRLEALNGREDYEVKAQETLETFAGVVEHFGLVCGELWAGAAADGAAAGAGVRDWRRCRCAAAGGRGAGAVCGE